MIEIEIEGEQEAAVLDTGAPYLVCSPDLAERLWLDPEDALEATTIRIQGVPLRGRVHRANLILHAQEGNGLDFQATAFVPDTGQNLPANFLPISFLGLHGCLERMRFALDPSNETFYFGRHP
ncbi:MAG: retropepsin-like domain-containing protein [Acidobacteria bacterium]|nr:retropepsin-like domain-containing protein [Acidobacteriota bacterium]